jgi:hypothetical protein
MQVLAGNWDEVDAVLSTLQIAEADLGECLFAARRQKYLELLEARRTAEAIAYLQEQITPLRIVRRATQPPLLLLEMAVRPFGRMC